MTLFFLLYGPRTYAWLSAIAALSVLAGCGAPSPIACNIPTVPPATYVEATLALPTIVEAAPVLPSASPIPDAATATLPVPPTGPRYVTPEGSAMSRQAATGNERIIYIGVSGLHHDELWSATLDGRDSRRVLSATCSRYGNPCRIKSLAAAPAGKQIVYLVENTLHLASTDGSDDHVIAQQVEAVSSHPFSPDGSQLVFTRSQDANPAPAPQSSLWVIPVDGGEPRQIVPWGFFYASPAWLSDQELVFSQAFTGTPPSNWKTFRVAASGAENPREIGPGRLLELAPDRTTMLMLIEVGADNNQRQDLSLVSVDGGVPRQLIQGGDSGLMAAWSPDGAAIAVYEPATTSLTILDPSSGGRHELLDLPAEYLMYSLTWDTRGQNLFYWDLKVLIRFEIASGAELIVARRRGRFAADIWTVLVTP